MIDAGPGTAGWTETHRQWLRAGQLLGLLFLIGPVSDLADASVSPGRVAAIVVALAGFDALYLLLLPPAPPIAQRGRPAIRLGLLVLAALAALPLALGAPRSFATLFVYVVVAAALLLPPRVAGVVVAIMAAALAAGFAVAGAGGSTVAAYTLTVVALGTVMIALGSAVRANEQLRAARDELARSAVYEERVRIARDLHDLLGHTLSLIVLKSELAMKLVEDDPARAKSELTEVQDVTRRALNEVRGAVQGYRQRSFAEALEGARATLTAAGIECRVDSRPRELPTEVERVLAWAVREGSTNVVRHSGASACSITLDGDASVVSLQIDDAGAGLNGASLSGTGLTGLAERAHALHGTLETGARPGGGFRLRLTLPLRTR